MRHIKQTTRRSVTEASVLDSIEADFRTTIDNLNRQLKGEDPEIAVVVGRRVAATFFKNASEYLREGFIEKAEEYM
jgi:hypothetical protein